MKSLAVTVSVVAALVVVAVAADLFITRDVNNRIAASAESGTLDGQSQGNWDGAAQGQSNGSDEGNAAGDAAGAAEGSAAGSQEGIVAGGNAGEEDGSDDGLQDGIIDGSSKGKAEGYEAGKNKGTDAGYEDGFAQGIGAGYLIRNPTYNEAVEFLMKTTAVNAAEINTEAEARGIRTGYVGFETADLDTGYYELVAFETIDKGLLYFTSVNHVQVKLELGKRYSTLNGFASPTNDTITKITIIW